MLLFLVFCVLFLLRFTESSSVESNKLSSVDIIAFDYSLDAAQHWDCPRVGDRVAKAEEARIWQTAIPDARIEEIVVSSENRALQKAEQYKWINEPSSDTMQNRVILGMRRPDFDGNTAPVKVLYSRSKQVNQDTLSVMLPQLEQSKDKIMEWMARNQVSIPSMPPKTTGPLAKRSLLVPQATNYHPRVFKHPYFTTGDLVAWMALAAASRQKGHADAFKFFKAMAQSFLPSFNVSLEAVPTSSAGKPTKAIYLHRPFQYVPAGADLAFYFDGNRGKFLKTHEDSIVLNRPEGTVDGQQHAALVLSSNANGDASSLEAHPTKADITMREAFCKELEKALALDTSSGATDAEAIDVSTIRSRAARLERDSFLEAQRKVLESKPTLLIELLPEKLVKLVIEYFSDDTYPVIVSTHTWSFKDNPGVAVDSARLYVMTHSEGLKSLNHSLANLKEDERCCIDLGDPQWFDYRELTSSQDGRCVSFSHKYKVSTKRRKQTKCSTKWLMQGNDLEGGKPKRVAFDEENLSFGLLSRDGQTLFSHNERRAATYVYRVKEEAGENFTAPMKFEFKGYTRVVSEKGNRVIVAKGERLEIRDIGKDASRLVCPINETTYMRVCALNEDGSEAAFVKGDKLLIMEVDNVVQPVIASVKIPESLGEIFEMVYSDENKLHVLHKEGSVSLFDPLKKALIPIEAPQKGQQNSGLAISPNACYIATILYVREEKSDGKRLYKTIVKRKPTKDDWRNVFGYDADKATSNLKQTESPPEER